ncbi:outer-membrane lipoprotein carrier protein LolA [Microvirga sp. ACRRW]|uniref:outer-membrane lipoprotein carrier protein LolA n=1 Tax=Microvirga sp. ACRRW TaxID=2918205 RepID=UPI001EF45D4B|nr:outer-membrane lipoprotein carrier protein LolA [Microvirga sp. ACRRW]MCG7394884.1 outer-membrane lipoprotein carrier protein LolA [Microvirga sp. ACRRW]
MRPVSLIGLVTVASALAGPLTAAAQTTLPMDMILPPKRPIAQGFNATAPSLPTSSFHNPSSPAQAPAVAQPARPTAAVRPVNAEQLLAATAPLPPARPATAEAAPVPQAEPIDIAPKPIVTASMGPVGQGQPLPNSAIVERANSYFTNLNTLVADFTQVGGDGRRMGGTLYLQRPGKVRFEYDTPSSLEVVADGRSVAVRDRKLATQDLYLISQTPLKFLLREKVNLGQDIKITGISNEPNAVRINLEDTATLGGTSRITLFFDPEIQNLSQWRIVDAQGFQTMVVLNQVQKGRRIDQDLFKIQYEEIRGDHK